jgi:hypothetical protein
MVVETMLNQNIFRPEIAPRDQSQPQSIQRVVIDRKLRREHPRPGPVRVERDVLPHAPPTERLNRG